MATRRRAGGLQRVWAEGSREVSKPRPLPIHLDVHAREGDDPRLQVTPEEAPQTGSNADPIDHQQWRAVLGRIDADRSQHQPERRIDADRALQAGGWQPGCELGDGTFVERAPDGGRAEQQLGAKVEDGSLEQHRADRDPPPLGASQVPRLLQRARAFKLKVR